VGIGVDGDGNLIEKNVVTDTGSADLVEKNKAAGSGGHDLRDTAGTNDHGKNKFGSSLVDPP
jgi:hypothetical protein